MKKNQEIDGWRQFLTLCTEAKSPSDLNNLLNLFLTHEEKHDLATRFLIIEMLIQNEKPQREIAKDLQVSISKITRGSNALKEIDDKLRGFLNTHMS